MSNCHRVLEANRIESSPERFFITRTYSLFMISSHLAGLLRNTYQYLTQASLRAIQAVPPSCDLKVSQPPNSGKFFGNKSI